MTDNDYWLKPMMIVIAIVAFIIFLVEAVPTAFPLIDWSPTRTTIIGLLPYLVVFGVGVFVLVYITGRK